MRKELEYTKKLVLVSKLFRDGLLSEREYAKVKSKLMDLYLFDRGDSFVREFKTA